MPDSEKDVSEVKRVTAAITTGELEPRDRLARRFTLAPPAPRTEAEQVPDPNENYAVVRFRCDKGTVEQLYQVKGDHLYIAELNVSAPIYVRFGKTNPWIRVREGAVYHRKFSQLSVKMMADDNAYANFPTDCVFYASVGPFVEPQRRTNGVTLHTIADNFVATPAPVRVFGGYDAPFNVNALTTGKTGGVVAIKNTDLVNTLFVQWANGGSGWPLNPGESLTFDLAGQFGSQFSGVLVYCTAGTCNYVAMLSPVERDLFAVDNPAQGGITP